MIIKQSDKIVSDDKLTKAGYEAENAMAVSIRQGRNFDV